MTGLQSARILSKRGVPVVGIAQDASHYALTSNCVGDSLIYERGSGVVGDIMRVISRAAVDIDGPFMLLPCSDWAVRAISSRRDQLPETAKIVLPEHGVIDMLMDKEALAKFAEDGAFDVPKSEVVDVDALPRHEWSVTFPVVLKPARKSTDWDDAMPGKVVICEDRSQLLELAAKLPTTVGSLIVQEWIPGGEDRLHSCNLYITRDGEVACTFVARKLRQWPPKAGTSASGESVLDPRVADMAVNLFAKAGHIGLGYIEAKYDERDDRYVLIEPNIGRPTGRSAISDGGGVALLYTAYCDSLGFEIPHPGEQAATPNKWVYLRHDVQAAIVGMLHGELTPWGWAKSLRGDKTFAVWDPADTRPFFADLRHTVMRLFRGALRRMVKIR